MTRKDYILIASVLRSKKPERIQYTNDDAGLMVFNHVLAKWQGICLEMSNSFGANPKFNRLLFLLECKA